MDPRYKDGILVFGVVFSVIAIFFLQKEYQDTYSLALTLQKEFGELKKCRSDIDDKDNNKLTELQKEQTYLNQQLSKLTEEQAKLSGGFAKVQKLASHLEKLTELQREQSQLGKDEIESINNDLKDLGSIRGENERDELPTNDKTETQQVQQGTWIGFACFLITSTHFIICTLAAMIILLQEVILGMRGTDRLTKCFVMVVYLVLSAAVIGNGCYYRLYSESDQHGSWIGFACFSIMVLLILLCGCGALAIFCGVTLDKMSRNDVEAPCQVLIIVLIGTFILMVTGNGFYYYWYNR